jgi:hypothetical protein
MSGSPVYIDGKVLFLRGQADVVVHVAFDDIRPVLWLRLAGFGWSDIVVDCDNDGSSRFRTCSGEVLHARDSR